MGLDPNSRLSAGLTKWQGHLTIQGCPKASGCQVALTAAIVTYLMDS